MADEVLWRPTLRRKSPFGKPVRPFSPFSRIREQQPNHLEVERFEMFGPTRAEEAWLRRRRHAPLDLRVPAAWNLDAIYLRHAGCSAIECVTRIGGSCEEVRRAYAPD
jgi:hypothetical protein